MLSLNACVGISEIQAATLTRLDRVGTHSSASIHQTSFAMMVFLGLFMSGTFRSIEALPEGDH